MYGIATKAKNVYFIFDHEIQDSISVYGSLINQVKCKLRTLYRPRMILIIYITKCKNNKIPLAYVL